MADTKTQPLPPGRSGLPLLGETLTFLKNSFGFVLSGIQQHGPVFRTSILGRKTAIIAGPEACECWVNPELIIRKGAMPPHVQKIFGGPTVLPTIDGEQHVHRKQIMLKGFTPALLTTYIDKQQALVERALSEWASQDKVRWVQALKALAIEGICSNVMGLSSGPEMDALLADYDLVGGGLSSLPIPLPGTAYTKSMKAVDRILDYFETVVLDHQKNPSEDGLSHILRSKADDGSQISVDDARREIHHVVLAGLIIWAEFATTAIELLEHPEVLARLRKEIEAQSPSGAITPQQLRAMPYLLQVVQEVKRIRPMVPAQFGIAKQDFTLGGTTIPKGWMVLLGVHACNMYADVYPTPERFDPERFSAARAEHLQHKHAFVPQGPGPETSHRCPGLDYATIFMQVFTILLVRDYDWSFPSQNMALQWDLIPPEPKDGLLVTLTKRS